jgi:hypothetical protein
MQWATTHLQEEDELREALHGLHHHAEEREAVGGGHLPHLPFPNKHF